MPSAEALLRAIAKNHKKRVGVCQHYDRNVCDFHWGELTVRRDSNSKNLRVSDPIILSGGPFTHKVALLHTGKPVLLWANRDSILISVRGELRHRVLCSINRPNANDFMRATQLGVDGKWNCPVFIRSALKQTEELLAFVSSSELQEAVRASVKQNNDSLHFSVGEASLYLHPQSELEITNAIEVLSRFVGSFRPQRELWDLTELPPEFQHLAPLIREWAECDDDVRSDLVNLVTEASVLSIRKLVQSVAPLFDQITRFLNSFGEGSLPEAAIALQALAECAAEAQIAMKDRNDRN
jgi:hypothetical protein